MKIVPRLFVRRDEDGYVLRLDVLLLAVQELKNSIDHGIRHCARTLDIKNPERGWIFLAVLDQGFDIAPLEVILVINGLITEGVRSVPITEKRINGLYQLGCRTKVLVQTEGPLFHIWTESRAPVSVDVASTKRVNRLLGITHEEQGWFRTVRSIKEDALEDLELDGVRVLELVHKSSLELLAQMGCENRSTDLVSKRLLKSHQQVVKRLR